MKTSFALIAAATSVFVFTQAAAAQCDCQQTVSYYAPVATTAYYAPTTAYYASSTTVYYPTSAYYAQPRRITGAVVITAVVITAATIAAGRSAPAGAAGPVFVESTEGGIVVGGKRRACRR